jgi:hypothetical protein
MKLSITSAVAIAAIGAFSASAIAGGVAEPKGPPQTMGDEGKLPASETMRNAVPDMTGPNADGNANATRTEDGRLRMGDEAGKLPATGTVSDKVPEMRGAVPGQE